eukprot:747539-Hanusia_phi.AAC.5
MAVRARLKLFSCKNNSDGKLSQVESSPQSCRSDMTCTEHQQPDNNVCRATFPMCCTKLWEVYRAVLQAPVSLMSGTTV